MNGKAQKQTLKLPNQFTGRGPFFFSNSATAGLIERLFIASVYGHLPTEEVFLLIDRLVLAKNFFHCSPSDHLPEHQPFSKGYLKKIDKYRPTRSHFVLLLPAVGTQLAALLIPCGSPHSGTDTDCHLRAGPCHFRWLHFSKPQLPAARAGIVPHRSHRSSWD